MYTVDLLSAKCRALIFPLQRGAERLASRDNVCEGGEEGDDRPRPATHNMRQLFFRQ